MSIPIQEQLEKYLFREGAYTYAVLDGASVPDLPQRIFDFKPWNICLYRGELSDEMIHVAPYLVLLEKGSEFSKWLLTECWGKHWGIFAQSPVSLSGMRKHFRSLLTVDDDLGNPMLFRFYDPRVLAPFLLTCAIDELNIIFGSVKYYFSESFDKAELVRMHVADGTLVETKLFFGID
jgi:hypothetical protein